MTKILIHFYRLLMVLSALAMVATFVIVMLGITARLMQWDIGGLDAYAGYAIAAALFLALPGAFKHGDHIRVTLLLDRVSPRVRTAIEWWCLGLGFVLAVYLAWYAAHLVWVSYDTHDVSPSADITPLWIPQLSAALGCLGFALAFAHALVERWHGRQFVGATTEAAHVE